MTTVPPFQSEDWVTGSIVFIDWESGRVRGYNCDYADLEEIAENFSSLLLDLVEQALEWENCAENCEVSVWQRTSGSACWSRQKFHQWQEITYPGKTTEEIGGAWEVDYLRGMIYLMPFAMC